MADGDRRKIEIKCDPNHLRLVLAYLGRQEPSYDRTDVSGAVDFFRWLVEVVIDGEICCISAHDGHVVLDVLHLRDAEGLPNLPIPQP